MLVPIRLSVVWNCIFWVPQYLCIFGGDHLAIVGTNYDSLFFFFLDGCIYLLSAWSRTLLIWHVWVLLRKLLCKCVYPILTYMYISRNVQLSMWIILPLYFTYLWYESIADPDVDRRNDIINYVCLKAQFSKLIFSNTHTHTHTHTIFITRIFCN